MKVELHIDRSEQEPRVVLFAPGAPAQIQDLFGRLQAVCTQTIHGYSEQGIALLPVGQILRIYAQSQKVYAETEAGTYTLHARLYELEQSLDASLFVRISNSEIVNSRKIKKLNAKLSGTIGVELENGVYTYASRRYVKRIKSVFGL